MLNTNTDTNINTNTDMTSNTQNGTAASMPNVNTIDTQLLPAPRAVAPATAEDILGHKPVALPETRTRKSPSNAGFERQDWWEFRHKFTQRQLVLAQNNGVVTDDMILPPTPASNGYPRIATAAVEAMIEAGMTPSGKSKPIDWPGKYTTHPAPVAAPTKQEAQAKIKEGLVALMGGKKEMTLDDLVGEMVNAMAGDKGCNDTSLAE